MKWLRKVYAHQWHAGQQEYKTAGFQMTERINAEFARTDEKFPWQAMLNYTQGKIHMTLKKKKNKKKINIPFYKYIVILWFQWLL